MTVRLLVTGFTPFPGAPVNPTEHLIRHFEDNPPLCNQDVEMRFAVLPVDYDQAIPALDAVSGDFDPHVAVHFGLADEARGFRLERLARNAIAARQPDNAGSRPPNAAIDPAGRDMPSTLPLELIAQALDCSRLLECTQVLALEILDDRQLGHQAVFRLADPGSPTMVRDSGDDSALYVLMPMRV